MIRRLIILLLIVGGFAQDSPCEDENYLKLKKKKLDEMSDREYEYFTRKDKECYDYTKINLTKPPLATKQKLKNNTKWSGSVGLMSSTGYNFLSFNRNIMKKGSNEIFLLIGLPCYGIGWSLNKNNTNNGFYLGMDLSQAIYMRFELDEEIYRNYHFVYIDMNFAYKVNTKNGFWSFGIKPMLTCSIRSMKEFTEGGYFMPLPIISYEFNF